MGMNKYWCVFKLASDSNTKVGSMESKVAVGLKILTTTCKTHSHSNPIFQRNQIPPQPQPQPQPQLNCFLKSCFLCHKHLSVNKDVYMYRGDQGFCSEECRSRQIYIDDLTQVEISTNKMKFKMKMMRQSLHAGRCNDDHHNRHRRKSTASPVFS